MIFDLPEVFSNSGRTIVPLKMFGYSFDQPFTILGIDFPAGAAFLIFATFLFGAMGSASLRCVAASSAAG